MSNYKKAYQIAREAGKQDGIFKGYKQILENSFIFGISNPLSLLLSLTDSDFDVDNLRLPYPNVFLDTKFEWEDMNVFGITLSQLQLKGDLRANIYLSYLFYKEQNGNKDIKITLKRFDELDNKNLEFYEVNQKIKLLIINFLDFLNNPELEFVEKKLNKYEMGTMEKKSMGCSMIALNGKLKRYVDEIGEIINTKGKMMLRNSHWVRGHWRRYESDFYKSMKGKKEWIYPFIRGLKLQKLRQAQYKLNYNGEENI